MSLANRLVAIDVLRAVAVLAVLATHLPFPWTTEPSQTVEAAASGWLFPPGPSKPTDYGGFGVGLFW